MKYHFIYKTVCIITNKYYIGMHSTPNLNDGYIGSGKIIKSSILKYGKSLHSFEILEFVDTLESLVLREKEIVNKDLLKDPLCMNLYIGGTGFTEHSEISKNNISKKLKKPYSEIYGKDEAVNQRKKRSIKTKQYWENLSADKKQQITNKISKSLKTRNFLYPKEIKEYTCPHCNKKGKGNTMYRHHFEKCPIFTGKPRKGHKLSDEQKNKLSISLKGRIYENRRGIPPANKGKKSERIICPYCDTDVAISIKNRNHFDNCKLKI